jgi:hypothetical protein
MKIEELGVEKIFEAVSAYEKRFGDAPVGIMDGGGPEGLLDLIKTAFRENKPIPDPYIDLPDGTPIY